MSRSSLSSSSEDLPLYDPEHTGRRPKHKPLFLARFRTSYPNTTFFGSAALLGFLFYALLSSSNRYLRPVEQSASASQLEAAYVSLPPETIASELIDYHHLELDELHSLVGKTKGFYGRDYSLWLGWNNMRYIIDAAFLHARLLNRTLVLPSFVYARACEYRLEVCADYADMVNRGDAMSDNQWRNRPIDEQMGYRIPLPLMLNITRMRSIHPVILVSDYLRLHGLPADIESGRGNWDREKYHSQASIFAASPSRRPSLFVVENQRYDPAGVVRVDTIPPDMQARGSYAGHGVDGRWPEAEESAISKNLRNGLSAPGVVEWGYARDRLRQTAAKDVFDLDRDEDVQLALQDNGWEVLYTFDSIQGSDLTKTVINPIRQVAPRSALRGWKDDYGEIDADVLILEGETHLGRKAGAMRFTTAGFRGEFQRTVLHHLVRNDVFRDLGSKLAQRMYDRVDGRLWMGAHLRRGDFVHIGWTGTHSLEDHINKVKNDLRNGHRVLEGIESIEPYEILDIQPNSDLVTRERPHENDVFYVATDERSEAGLQTLHSHSAILLSDLLDQEDRRTLGWPLMLTDVRALVEQELLAHSAFFVGNKISSVSGGIANMRASYGADRRTLHME